MLQITMHWRTITENEMLRNGRLNKTGLSLFPLFYVQFPYFTSGFPISLGCLLTEGLVLALGRRRFPEWMPLLGSECDQDSNPCARRPTRRKYEKNAPFVNLYDKKYKYTKYKYKMLFHIVCYPSPWQYLSEEGVVEGERHQKLRSSLIYTLQEHYS